MNVNFPIVNNDADAFRSCAPLLRVIASPSWAGDGGDGWRIVGRIGDDAASGCDCWLIAGIDLPLADAAAIDRSGVPLVIAGAGAIPPEWIDRADGFLLPDDDAATIAAVLARAARPAGALRVADLSDGMARTINALSAETSRIAEQLSKLADVQRSEPAPMPTPIDSRLVRRVLKLRRDRERYFPAEIFADPAWDMLLDLTAARLEGKRVPVSSLCIAASVPTTTALRWIRSLTEAGLFDRYTDPTDARRSHIEITDAAAKAMMAYLRAFSEGFALR